MQSPAATNNVIWVKNEMKRVRTRKKLFGMFHVRISCPMIYHRLPDSTTKNDQRIIATLFSWELWYRGVLTLAAASWMHSCRCLQKFKWKLKQRTKLTKKIQYSRLCLCVLKKTIVGYIRIHIWTLYTCAQANLFERYSLNAFRKENWEKKSILFLSH